MCVRDSDKSAHVEKHNCQFIYSYPSSYVMQIFPSHPYLSNFIFFERIEYGDAYFINEIYYYFRILVYSDQSVTSFTFTDHWVTECLHTTEVPG